MGVRRGTNAFLQMAILNKRPLGIKFKRLPPEYNYMVELSQRAYPGLNPVVLATRGALRYQDLMDAEH